MLLKNLIVPVTLALSVSALPYGDEVQLARRESQLSAREAKANPYIQSNNENKLIARAGDKDRGRSKEVKIHEDNTATRGRSRTPSPHKDYELNSMDKDTTGHRDNRSPSRSPSRGPGQENVNGGRGHKRDVVVARGGDKDRGRSKEVKIHEDNTATRGRSRTPSPHKDYELNSMDKDTTGHRDNRSPSRSPSRGPGQENVNGGRGHKRDVLVARGGDKDRGRSKEVKIHEDNTATRGRSRTPSPHKDYELNSMDKDTTGHRDNRSPSRSPSRGPGQENVNGGRGH